MNVVMGPLQPPISTWLQKICVSRMLNAGKTLLTCRYLNMQYNCIMIEFAHDTLKIQYDKYLFAKSLFHESSNSGQI